jgi:hypothetical protein
MGSPDPMQLDGQSVAAWNAVPTSRTVASSKGPPAICRESGRQAGGNPIGTTGAG